MSYIYRISKTLLDREISKRAYYMTGNMLDVGCGVYGRYNHLFNATITGVDVLPSENTHVIGSAEALPFGDGQFDTAFCSEVFEHLKNPEKATQEIHRILKTCGYLLFTAPQYIRIHSPEHDYWRFTKFGLIELFTRNGFEVVECAPVGGHFSVVGQGFIHYLKVRFNLKRRWWLRGASFLLRLMGTFVIWLDKIDTSEANRADTIGWVFVFKKI